MTAVWRVFLDHRRAVLSLGLSVQPANASERNPLMASRSEVLLAAHLSPRERSASAASRVREDCVHRRPRHSLTIDIIDPSQSRIPGVPVEQAQRALPAAGGGCGIPLTWPVPARRRGDEPSSPRWERIFFLHHLSPRERSASAASRVREDCVHRRPRHSLTVDIIDPSQSRIPGVLLSKRNALCRLPAVGVGSPSPGPSPREGAGTSRPLPGGRGFFCLRHFVRQERSGLDGRVHREVAARFSDSRARHAVSLLAIRTSVAPA